MLYLWVKALHIISMVVWFAGVFYLPRLFVYHAQTNDHVGQERFKVMERKLFWVIMTPGAIATVITGLTLVYLHPMWLKAGWMHAKLLLVGCLIIYHISCGMFLKAFADNQNRYSSVFFRWYNELPTIVLIGAVIAVVVKPM
tara:strand:+ start:5193 stop:5618 length:426 start_codon:yes stop_codon:yes gene_type:complete